MKRLLFFIIFLCNTVVVFAQKEKANKYIQKCYKDGEHTFEWLHKTLDDKIFLVEVNLKKVYINNREIIQALFKDIEPIKALKNEL